MRMEIDNKELIDRIKGSGISALKEVHGLKMLELLKFSDSVVDAYGRVYQANKAFIVDEKLLPFLKDDIKVALKIQFHAFAIKNQIEAMENIARAYTSLSRFQNIEGNDKPLLEELNEISIPGTDIFGKRNQGPGLTEQEQIFLDRFGVFNAYVGRIEAERELLRQDFADFINELAGLKK
jgi:hypothetical protein